MYKITGLLSAAVLTIAAPSSAQATSVTLNAEVSVLANVLFLSKDKALKLCNENPELKNCHIVIASNENEKFFDVKEDLAYVNLQRNQYPVRMIDFE